MNTLQMRLQASPQELRFVLEGYIIECVNSLSRAIQLHSDGVTKGESNLTLMQRFNLAQQVDFNLQQLFHTHDLLFPKLDKLGVDTSTQEGYDEHKVEALREEWRRLVGEFRGE